VCARPLWTSLCIFLVSFVFHRPVKFHWPFECSEFSPAAGLGRVETGSSFLNAEH
jgi:hypothetical protein